MSESNAFIISTVSRSAMVLVIVCLLSLLIVILMNSGLQQSLFEHSDPPFQGKVEQALIAEAGPESHESLNLVIPEDMPCVYDDQQYTLRCESGDEGPKIKLLPGKEQFRTEVH